MPRGIREMSHRGLWRPAWAEGEQNLVGGAGPWLQPHHPTTLISLPTPFLEPGNQAAHNN